MGYFDIKKVGPIGNAHDAVTFDRLGRSETHEWAIRVLELNI
jgi:hypothetical protein